MSDQHEYSSQQFVLSDRGLKFGMDRVEGWCVDLQLKFCQYLTQPGHKTPFKVRSLIKYLTPCKYYRKYYKLQFCPEIEFVEHFPHLFSALQIGFLPQNQICRRLKRYSLF